MNIKSFYDNYKIFSGRSIFEYFISPGIKCKFDTLLTYLGNKQTYTNGIDLGSSGNSFLLFFENVVFKSFFDIAFKPLTQYRFINDANNRHHKEWNPLCGDFVDLPYRSKSFDFICSLDTLEHIKNDDLAISEISRILRKDGIVLITVPHRMKYFTNQDKIIGHLRRYEINQIVNLFRKYKLICLNYFGVYGQLMKFSFLQTLKQKDLAGALEKLRSIYKSNKRFRKFWDVIMKFSSKLMKLEAKIQKIKRIMNLGFIFKKIP